MVLIGSGLWCYYRGIPKIEQAQDKYMTKLLLLLQDDIVVEHDMSNLTTQRNTMASSSTATTTKQLITKTVLKALYSSSYMKNAYNKATGYVYQTYPLMLFSTMVVTCFMPRNATFLAVLYAHGIYGLLQDSASEMMERASGCEWFLSSSSSSSLMTREEQMLGLRPNNKNNAEKQQAADLEPFADIPLTSCNMEVSFALTMSCATAILCIVRSLLLSSGVTPKSS